MANGTCGYRCFRRKPSRARGSGRCEGLQTWDEPAFLRDPVHDFSRDIFELESDDIDGLNERVQQLPVRVRAIEFLI